MTTHPVAAQAPASSQVAALLPNAYFHDAWSIRAAAPELTALGQFLRVASTTPAWIERLMSIRNAVVSKLGLKSLGEISQLEAEKTEAHYKPGDRVGIFTLISNSPNEVLLGDNDKHLHVVVSVHKRTEPELEPTHAQPTHAQSTDAQTPYTQLAGPAATVTVTTVVHVHNWLGRLYMLPVTPLHRIITKAMVTSVGRGV